MIETPTVLVLGAGASMPYGFPSGGGLKDRILDIQNTSGAKQIYELGFDAGELGSFQRRFQASHLASIDRFLQHCPDYSPLGKSCIAACIRANEQQFLGKFLDSSAALNDWYPLLWNAIADVSENDFHRNRLKIITFNYDRSLEIFLSFAYASTYGIELAPASFKLRQTVEILHVYGDLGALTTADHDCFKLGIEMTPRHLQACQESIRVIGDRVQVTTREKCGQLISRAGVVCFLGFGFAAENCDAILASAKSELTPRNRLFCGSASGLHLGERVAAAHRCGVALRFETGLMAGVERFADVKCEQAIRNFGVLAPVGI